jgi:hypothetical protein
MPEDKSDMRLVANRPAEGSPPAGLRLLKTVRGNDESLYLLMMPGVTPDPLKLSIHPTGDIHLKARGVGLIARIDRDALFENLKSGTLDATLAKFLTPKLRHEVAEGVIVPPDVFPFPEIKPGEALKDVDFSMDRLAERMTKIELDDLSELPKAIGWLRSEGHLPVRAMLFLASKGSDRPVVFASLMDSVPKDLPERLPEGLPFPKSLQALFDRIRTYGGLLLVIPDEAELLEMARAVGLGDFVEGLNRLGASLGEPAVEAAVRATLEELVTGFQVPVEALVRARPIRPLKSMYRLRRISPRSRRTSRWRTPRYSFSGPGG